MSIQEWRTTIHIVSAQHLNECWKGSAAGGRDMGPELEAAIDRFIDDVFAKYATPTLATPADP